MELTSPGSCFFFLRFHILRQENLVGPAWVQQMTWTNQLWLKEEGDKVPWYRHSLHGSLQRQKNSGQLDRTPNSPLPVLLQVLVHSSMPTQEGIKSTHQNLNQYAAYFIRKVFVLQKKKKKKSVELKKYAQRYSLFVFWFITSYILLNQ